MTPLVIALIAATLLVFWFIRRRTNLRGEEEHSVPHPAESDPIPDKTSTSISEIECLPDPPPSEQMEEVSSKNAREEPEGGPISRSAESDTSARQEAEPHIGNKANVAQLVASNEAGSKQQLTRANSEQLSPIPDQAPLEQEEARIDIVISGISDENSSRKPIVSAPTVTATPADHNMQAVHAVSEREVGQTATELADDEGTDAEAEQASARQLSERAIAEGTEKTPLRYRPPPQKPPRQGTARPVIQKPEHSAPDEVALEIRIRLRFDRFGFCEIRLLPERKPELDTEVEVKSGGLSLHLVAQEDWYEDLQFEDIGTRLRQGLELKGHLADQRRARWLLSGRDIYVLASHPRASYFVSTSRLVLGRSHVVLCVVELLPQVEAILREAECQEYTKLYESHGVPPGWIGLRGVSPTKAIPLMMGSDPFYALKPAPDIEIELEGGVCLRNSIWLAGYPPRIKLHGEANGTIDVLIDGKQAQYTAEGTLVADSACRMKVNPPAPGAPSRPRKNGVRA